MFTGLIFISVVGSLLILIGLLCLFLWLELDPAGEDMGESK